MPSEILTTVYSQHTVYLQRIGATLGRGVIPYLEVIDSGVQAIFNKYLDKPMTVKNRLKIQEQINTLAKEQLQLYTNSLKKEIREVGINEAAFASSTLDSVVDNDDFNSTVPVNAVINATAISTPVKVGDNAFSSYNSLMTNYWRKWTEEIDGIVMAGFADGTSIEQVSNDVYKQLRLTTNDTSKNTLTRAKRSARQLAITGTNHYANQARVAFVDTNDDILKGYRFIAVLDSKTSRQCRALDQRFIPKDSPKLSSLTPPIHPNCRSALTYEVDDRFKLDDKDTQRASSFEIDGERDPKPTSSDGIYYDKLKKLNARDQDNVLGPTLGKAFRKMDNPADFAKATIDSLGNPLTIKQMKSRQNELGRVLRSQSGRPKLAPKTRKANNISEASNNVTTINKSNKITKPKGSVETIKSSAGVQRKVDTRARATLNKTLSGDESSYLEYYKGDGFYKSNDILRNPSRYSAAEVESAIKMRDSIDSAILKSTIDNDALVYRGIRDKGLFAQVGPESIGAELSIDTAQSVAKDANIALNYSGAIKSGNNYFSAGDEAVIFKIKTKKGQNAIDMESLSGIGNTSESELLLRSGGKYVVTGVDDRFTPDGKLSLKIIEVDYVD